ncbi:MAG: malto-oligosyltrehalose synthase [Candidatus Polarisedimenticolia bacterium]
MAARRIIAAPVSTCRLQFSRTFGFREAARLVAYLHDLGVTDLYASPLAVARQGSTHGYDVVDPRRLNSVLGSQGDFIRMSRSLRRRGMGLLLDIVPNHMAAHPENPWWMDVLRRGAASRWAPFFDIRWRPPRGDLGQVVLPVLGADYEAELENGAFRLSWEDGEVWLRYGGLRLPLDPRTVRGLEPGRLLTLTGRPGDRGSFQRLDALLARQHYRLIPWRRAGEEVNYRRFFDISDLVCLREEDPRVFETVHRLCFRLIAAGHVTGLRVDHVDGLADPEEYLSRLRARAGPAVYIVVEKILASGEHLPSRWPVAGTTGYDLLNDINEILVDPRGAHELDSVYEEMTGDLARFDDVVYGKKKRMMETHFRGEVRELAWVLARLIPVGRRGARSLSGDDLERALMEVTACLPVYRTYMKDGKVRRADRQAIRTALREASRRGRARLAAVAALGGVLLPAGRISPEQMGFRRRWQQFTGPVMAKGGEDTALYVYSRLLSLNEVGGNPGSPGLSVEEFHRRVSARARGWRAAMNATATHDTKRGEDVRARINVLSEIPAEWGARLRLWRQLNEPRRRMVRGVPVPDRREELQLYQMLLGAWPLRSDGVESFRRRFASYLTKAAREAKVHTRWRRPVPEHEEALIGFMNAILAPARGNRFLHDFLEFQQRIAWHGALNGLASVLLKSAAPGVTDLYQGCELWDLRLVDPDNRRPVDWDRRRRYLADIARRWAAGPDTASELLSSWRDGRIKMMVIWRSLTLRRANGSLFLRGTCLPVRAGGPASRHVVAFARRLEGAWVLAAATRLSARLGLAGPPLHNEPWGITTLALPPGAPSTWTDVLTGRVIEASCGRGRGRIPAAILFGTLPIALLRAGSVREPA